MHQTRRQHGLNIQTNQTQLKTDGFCSVYSVRIRAQAVCVVRIKAPCVEGTSFYFFTDRNVFFWCVFSSVTFRFLLKKFHVFKMLLVKRVNTLLIMRKS